MKTLTLPVIKRWFDMQKEGIKTEEYRKLSNYWFSRLCLMDGKHFTSKQWQSYFDFPEAFEHNELVMSFKHFDQTKVTLGYPRHGFTDRILIFEHLGIEIGEGKEEWGAIEGELYFVIKHGKRIYDHERTWSSD
ncbi:MAG: hypothetical protein WAT92_19045 [Saprospiraceae bacterium]